MMDLTERFVSYVKEHRMFTDHQQLIVAVSGGVDSMVLVQLCLEAGWKPVVAHCNFSLRGDASDGDEEFVRSYAAAHGLDFEFKRFDTNGYATQKKISVQLAARELRYAWFETLLHLAGGPKKARLLTAHHLDDNTETMLMNFFRGTGITGLRGIRPLNEWIARPLLFARKDELLAYAASANILWRNDHSNEENKYTRNFFRNQLIPLITTVFPEVEQNLAANQERFEDISVLYRKSVQSYLKKLMHPVNNEVHIPFRRLLLVPASRTIAWEIFRQYGFAPSAIDSILALCESESGRYVASATHRVIRNRNWLIIAPAVQEGRGLVLIEQPGSITFEGGMLQVTAMDQGPAPVALPDHEAIVDAAAISFPLLLRPWKAGDYFYPLGMKKKKKVARFLIDRKVSKTDKEKVWVIESQKKIIWVAGHRIDDRFRVTTSTSQVLRFKLSAGV